VRWPLVGVGRKTAPPLDPLNDLGYQRCWAERVVRAERAIAAPTVEARHRILSQPEPTTDPPPDLVRYANCALFDTLAGPTPERTYAMRVFLYAAPLTAVAASGALQRDVHIEPPQSAGGLDAWYPVAFDRLPGAVEHYRVYRTLVLRITFLLRLAKHAYAQHADERVPRADRERHRRAEHRLYQWLDAHLLLAIGIDELGYVPRDDSGAMAALLECYAPDAHTAFTDSELPDLSRELGRCEFFSRSDAAEAARRDSPIVDVLMKSLPHRCEVREVAMNAADSSATNAGFFGLVKLLLAATFLGVYRRAKYRAGWRMRYAVYRLFFFTLDDRVRRRWRPAGPRDTRPPGGTAAALYADYDLDALAVSMRAAENGSRSPRSRRRRGGAARLQYTSYVDLVAGYHTSAQRAERDADTREKSAAQLRKNAVRTYGTAPPPPGTPLAPHQLRDYSEAEQLEAAVEPGRNGPAVRVLREAFRAGVHTANAMSRAQLEKNRGRLYYDQRLAADALPASGVELGGGQPSPPLPPPVGPHTRIKYAHAHRNVIPADRTLPGEEALARDIIVYRWLTTLVLRRKKASASGGAATSEHEYLFQNMLNLALREYLIFGLERWHEPVRHELFGRVNWASWETRVLILGDGLRARLDALYAEPCAPGAFLTAYSAYQYLGRATRAQPLNTHYSCGEEPFLDALLKTMQDKITDDGFGDQPVDHVVPRETELLLKHLLAAYRYPRVTPPLRLDSVARRAAPVDKAADGGGGQAGGGQAGGGGGGGGGGGQARFERYRETIVPAQLAYLIEPVGPAELPLGRQVDRAWIERELVGRARFPLGIFHATDAVVRRFAHVRTQYHLAPDADALGEFVNWLAEHSAYQFYLMHAFCRAVYRHLNVHSFALPRHILDHQLRTLRNHYCIPDSEPVPRSLLRALVCVDCQRCASAFAEPGQPHSAMAVGNNDVRFLAHTDDDEVIERLRARDYRPLPLGALRPADSYTAVLHHRSRLHTRAYDRFVAEGDDRGAAVALEDAPTPEQFATDAFAGAFADERRARFAAQTDRREQLYAGAPFADPRQRELRLVARGKGRLGELDFEAAMWREVDRRMRLVGDYGPAAGAPNRRSFLLLGHAMPGADERFAAVKWADAGKRKKTEGKKAKQLDTQRAKISRIFDDDKRAKKMVKYSAKRRKDALAMATYAQCARQTMLQIDLCGRALHAGALYMPGKEKRLAGEVVFACTDCLVPVRSRYARAIADRLVCDACYHASQRAGGAVAMRRVRGEPVRRLVDNPLSRLSTVGARSTRSAPRQLMLSPSFAALCDDVIAEGTSCIMDLCRTVKSGPRSMVGLEVLKDTDVGNETYGYVYFCAKHAAAYASLFRLPTIIALSTLENFLLEHKRNFDEVAASGVSFLDDVIRRAARSNSIGTAARAHETREKQARKEERERRRAQQKAAAKRIERRRDAARDAALTGNS